MLRKRLLVIGVLLGGLIASVLLGGCQDMGRAAAKLYGYKGNPFPGPCVVESVQTGTCVPVKRVEQKP